MEIWLGVTDFSQTDEQTLIDSTTPLLRAIITQNLSRDLKLESHVSVEVYNTEVEKIYSFVENLPREMFAVKNLGKSGVKQ